ncbi:MAG: hypothetical protein AAFQ42_14195 [Pseudomonadota bacterium]
MISSPGWLLPAFIANIVILLPVCLAMFSPAGTARIFDDLVPPSDGLHLLVAALWTSILVLSVVGLARPAFCAPILLAQIIYKSLWLATYIAPLAVRGEAFPRGITRVFAAIVVSYPVLFWLAIR